MSLDLLMDKHVYTIELASEDQFAAMKNEWTQLLSCNENATLFNTWEWQYTWWMTWGKELGGELYLLTAKNQSRELIGIAPLYRFRGSILKGIFNYYKLLFIGSSVGLRDTVRSEYLDFIYASEHEVVVQELLMYIQTNVQWSKALLSDIRTNSILFASLTSRYTNKSKYYVRAILKDVGVKIDTRGSFETYLELLGKNTRLACYNRRKRLKSSGDIITVCTNVCKSGAIESLCILNEVFIERWGKICFDEKTLKFYQGLMSYESVSSGVQFCKVLLNGEPISIAYNIDYNRIRYNLQLAFKRLDDKKVSMGNLQLGYVIQDAFNSKTINYFDLLAGLGKKTFYKENFNGSSYRLYTMEIIRLPILRIVYRIYDILKHLLRQ